MSDLKVFRFLQPSVRESHHKVSRVPFDKDPTLRFEVLNCFNRSKGCFSPDVMVAAKKRESLTEEGETDLFS